MYQEVLNADVIFVNHSGGKDSQAMLAHLKRVGLLHKCVVVHADLGEMEWEPMHGFIESNSYGLPVHVVNPKDSFFDLCYKYKRLPSGQARFCTDQLKTQPIKKWIRDYCAKNGFKRAINCIGIRSEESQARAAKDPWKLSDVSLVKQDLQVYEWYPIFDYTLDDVWTEIRNQGQTPHPVYAQGFSRLSCVFCVFGRIAEHQEAAKLKPELFEKMVKLEKDLGKTIRIKQVNKIKLPKYLEEYC